MTTPDAQQQPPQGQQPAQAPLAPPPAKKRGISRLVISLVVLVVLGGIGWYLSRDDALNAKVGDCLHQKGANDLSIVKCDSADANFTVLGRVGDKSESEVNNPANTICDQWPDSTNTYWEGKSGQKGTVLCLQKK
jgi:hypothetical protein